MKTTDFVKYMYLYVLPFQHSRWQGESHHKTQEEEGGGGGAKGGR